MGQDDSCGLCGKHYQECRHHRKEHILDNNGKLYCGRPQNNVIANDLNFYRTHDVDPFDICKLCANKIQKKTLRMKLTTSE